MPTLTEVYYQKKGYIPKGVKKCIFCGKEFIIYLKRDFERKKFCSHNCVFKHIQEKYPNVKENLKLGRTEENHIKACKTVSRKLKLGLLPKLEKALKKGPSPEARKRAGLKIRGEKHPKWIKDRTKVKRQRFDASERGWAGGIVAWRNDIFERDNYTCQICGERGGRLNAHHRKNWEKYSDLRFELSNGITLCQNCHYSIHYDSKKEKK